MPDAPMDLSQVLVEEYQALRPGMDFSGGSSRELFAKAHQQKKPFSALCISGGGIRSATFAMGAIQGLAERELLTQFDYLSTVSGGGYIGSWLTAWIQRAGGIRNVVPRLRRNAPAPAAGEVDPIDHLREYNNYLSPKLGLFSADTWTLAATVVRNILLNWLVLVPLLLCALLVPRLLLAVAKLGDIYREMHGSADPIASSTVVVWGLPVLCAFLLAFSVYNTARYLPGGGGKDYSKSDYLRMVLAPLVGAALSYSAFECLYYWGDKDIPTTIPQSIRWILTPCALGWIAFLVTHPRGGKSRARLLASLSVGLLLTAISTGVMQWLLIEKLLPLTSWALYVTIAPPLLVIAFDLGLSLFVGFSSAVLEDEDREWLARSSAWTQLFCFSWAAVCGLVLLVPGWAFKWRIAGGMLSGFGTISGWMCARGTHMKSGNGSGASGTMLQYAL